MLALLLSLFIAPEVCFQGHATLFEDMSYSVQPSHAVTCVTTDDSGNEISIAEYTWQGMYIYERTYDYTFTEPFPEAVRVSYRITRINVAQ